MTKTKISRALLWGGGVARAINHQQYKPIKVEMSVANLCVYDEDVGATLHHNPPPHDSFSSTDSAFTPPNRTRLSNIK